MHTPRDAGSTSKPRQKKAPGGWTNQGFSAFGRLYSSCLPERYLARLSLWDPHHLSAPESNWTAWTRVSRTAVRRHWSITGRVSTARCDARRWYRCVVSWYSWAGSIRRTFFVSTLRVNKCTHDVNHSWLSAFLSRRCQELFFKVFAPFEALFFWLI